MAFLLDSTRTAKATAGGGGSGKDGGPTVTSGGSKGSGGNDQERRRNRRLAELKRMSDDEFSAEVRMHQAAQWRESRLQAHVRDHRDDCIQVLGKALTPGEMDELSRDVLKAWDRLFTWIGPNDSKSYGFASQWGQRGSIIVVVARGQQIRTFLPLDAIEEWSARRRELVEVTDRGKRLGL